MSPFSSPDTDRKTQLRAEMLNAHPLTRGLAENDIYTLAKMCRIQEMPARTTFIHEGSHPESVYLIVKGGVRIFSIAVDGKEITLAFLGPQAVLGEIAYLDESVRSASAETIRETEMLVLRGQDFHNAIQQYPVAMMNLLAILAKRIRNTNQQIQDVVSTSLTDRTHKTLSILEKYFPNGEICFSHDDLALILGATRPRVTEVLHHLRDLGKLVLGRNKISISASFS